MRAHYAELGVNYIIYSQQIWSVDRGGEGWRDMADRGSTTATTTTTSTSRRTDERAGASSAPAPR